MLHPHPTGQQACMPALASSPRPTSDVPRSPAPSSLIPRPLSRRHVPSPHPPSAAVGRRSSGDRRRATVGAHDTTTICRVPRTHRATCPGTSIPAAAWLGSSRLGSARLGLGSARLAPAPCTCCITCMRSTCHALCHVLHHVPCYGRSPQPSKPRARARASPQARSPRSPQPAAPSIRCITHHTLRRKHQAGPSSRSEALAAARLSITAARHPSPVTRHSSLVARTGPHAHSDLARPVRPSTWLLCIVSFGRSVGRSVGGSVAPSDSCTIPL